MSRTNGYILLHKQMLDPECWLWQEKPFSKGRAWVDLLLKANFKDVTKSIKGQVVTIKRGQVLRGEETLATDWGWSRGKVRRFLKSIEKDGMCSVNGTPYGTVITIENYEEFQTERTSNGTADGTTDGTTDGTGMKEVKRSLNKGGVFDPPSAADVFSFFQEHDYVSDPEQFYLWYEGTNWTKKNGDPVKDWKSLARSWEQREKGYIEERNNKPPSNVPVKPEPPKYKPYKPGPERKSEPMTEEQRRKTMEAFT